jgi:hypothetical protein
MEEVSKNRDRNSGQTILKVVGGNPLATGGNSDRSWSNLSLVWQQEGILSARKSRANRREERTAANDLPPVQGWSWWRWLVVHGEGITVVLALMGFAWYLSKYDSRLEAVEKRVEGLENVKIAERLARIETKLEDIKSINDYLLEKIARPKAEMFLGTSDVGIFHVVNNEVTTDTKFSTPYKGSLETPSPKRKTFVTYTFEGIRDGFFFVRLQIEEEEGGKVVRALYDRHVKGALPTEVGKPDSTCFKFIHKENKSETPPFCFDIVLLERVGPDNLIFASAVKPKEAS